MQKLVSTVSSCLLELLQSQSSLQLIVIYEEELIPRKLLDTLSNTMTLATKDTKQ